ncbi:GerMN domain-containing protein [Synechococcus sp. PCC 6312]|uniref:GerMN domain-containing protein n=1 Tax=Synechococcus sp. (strain ATCC 27167 / PCC 6312) TaxID=195253 RepID=UPI00029F46E4|nr:GerMN domain-containing protein [Synechococcus sp. PCC 6312]AFY62626.1 sporulation/spore germination protein [Synechococcus sp. PCC 6312]
MPGQEQKWMRWGWGLGLVALVTIGGTAWWTFQSQAPQSVVPTPTSSPVVVSGQVELYWLNPQGTGLVKTPLTFGPISKNATAEELLTTGLSQLLSGPDAPTLTTTIPAGTKLETLDVKPDGIHINLSKEFKEGGGSTSMQGRLGQVLYTATSLNPTQPVWLSVNGQPLTVLGGEGLEVKQPLTRAEFEQSFALAPSK